MPKAHYDSHQLDDLVLQMMETERGGEQVYRAALRCAQQEVLQAAFTPTGTPALRRALRALVWRMAALLPLARR